MVAEFIDGIAEGIGTNMGRGHRNSSNTGIETRGNFVQVGGIRRVGLLVNSVVHTVHER